MIGASVEVLARELPRARLGEDPEGVHQARVATRRLRSDLRTFAPLLDDGWRVRTRAGLRRLTDALGAVRDLDVLETHLAAATDAAGVDPDGADIVLAALCEQRLRTHQDLVVEIDDDRTGALVDELRAAAADPPTTASALEPARRRLRPLVRRPWRKLARAVADLGNEPDMAELHSVRLLAKRARYAAEAVTEVYGRDARRFATAMRAIQDVLGDMNDAEGAADWLGRTAPGLDPAGAFAAGQLAHHFRGVADAHRHGWERSFRRAEQRSAWLK